SLACRSASASDCRLCQAASCDGPGSCACTVAASKAESVAPTLKMRRIRVKPSRNDLWGGAPQRHGDCRGRRTCPPGRYTTSWASTRGPARNLSRRVRRPLKGIRGNIGISLGPVTIQSRAGEQNERYGRGQGHEDQDQDFMDGRARTHNREVEYRGKDDEHRARTRAERGRMKSLVESPQAQQAYRAEHSRRRAGHHQDRNPEGRPRREFGSCRHSMTSPRIRNLASASVLVNPSSAMTSADSKYRVLPVWIPNTRSISIALTYRLSRLRTRSCARGPMIMRTAAQIMPRPSITCATRSAHDSTCALMVRRSRSTGLRIGFGASRSIRLHRPDRKRG